jgi:hypothetical protein
MNRKTNKQTNEDQQIDNEQLLYLSATDEASPHPSKYSTLSPFLPRHPSTKRENIENTIKQPIIDEMRC